MDRLDPPKEGPLAIVKLDRQPEKEPIAPTFAIVIIVILIIALVTMVVLTGFQRPDSSTRDSSIEFVIATEALSTGADIVISIGNATLYLPKDAIPMAGTISITWRPPNLFSVGTRSDWSRTLIVNIEYRNEAGVPYPIVALNKPARLCFSISQDEWLDYLNRPNEYQLQFYAEDEDPPRWEPLPTVAYPGQKELCGEIEHLSLFALAIKRSQSVLSDFQEEVLSTPEEPYAP